MILDDTRRASKIISDLLTFARQKEVKRVQIPAKKYLAEVSEKLKAYCETAEVAFSSDISALADEATVEIDSDQIYQVLFNLVQNAVHALKEKPDRKEILLSAQVKDSKITISVSDNGSGIPKENLSRIFEPFFSTKKRGTGLGLAIVKQIVEQHGGRISVASEVGKGSKFIIDLPM